MPTYIFQCEGCGAHRPFPLHDNELTEPKEKTVIQRHCLTCRTITTWALAPSERRPGKDRRGGMQLGDTE
jgi:hypothetical protein